jgi:chromosome segregation ATPase
MADKDSILKLTAALEKEKSTKQLNQDIKNMEKTINQLHLMAKLYQGESKTKINASIKELEKKVDVIRLKAEIDNKKLKADLDHALSNISLKEIKISEQGLKVSAMKIAQSLNSVLSKYTILPKIDLKPEEMKKDLTGIQSKVNAVTTAFGLAKTGIVKFKQSMVTLKDISPILSDISKATKMSREEINKLGKDSFQTAGAYGTTAKDYLLSVLSMAKNGYGSLSKELGELSLLAQSLGSISAVAADSFIKSLDTAYQYSGSVEKLTRAFEGVISVSMQSKIPLGDLTAAMESNALSAAKAGIGIDQLTAAEATLIASSGQTGVVVSQSFQSVLDQLDGINQSSGQLIEPIKRLEEMAKAYSSISSKKDTSLFGDNDSQEMTNPIKVLLEQWSLYEQLLANYSNGSQEAMAAAIASASTWESQLISLQNSWDSFIYSLTSQNQSAGMGSFLQQTLVSMEAVEENLKQIPQMLEEINGSLSSVGSVQISSSNDKIDSSEKSTPSIKNALSFDSIKSSVNDFKDISESVDELEEKLIKGEYSTDSFAESIAKNQSTLKDYLADLNGTDPSLSGYQEHLKKAGIQTDVLRLKTILLGGVYSAAIAIGAQLATAALAYLGQAIYENTHKMEVAADAARESGQALSEIQSKIQSINSELSSTAEKINQLNSKDNLSLVEQEELENLKRYNELLERQLGINRAIENDASGKAQEDSRNFFNKKDNYKIVDEVKYDSYSDELSVDINKKKYKGNPLDKIQNSMDAYDNIKQKIDSNQKEIDQIKESNSNFSTNQTYIQLALETSTMRSLLPGMEAGIKTQAQDIQDSSKNLDTEEDKDLISNISAVLDSFIVKFDGLSPTEKFDKIWNSDDFSKSKAELESKAVSGTLTAKDIDENVDFTKLKEVSGKTAEELVQHLNSIFADKIKLKKDETFKNAISQLPADEMEKYVNLLNSGDLNEKSIESFESLKKIMGDTNISAEDAIKNLKEASKGYVTTPELLSGMESLSQLMGTVQQEFDETGEIGTTNLSAIAKQFPELQNAVLEYSQGLIESDEFMAQLKAAYDNDTENYQINMLLKLENDETFFSTVRDRNQKLFEELAVIYGQDLKNWNNLVRAKSGIEEVLKNDVANITGGSGANTPSKDDLFEKYVNIDENGFYSLDEEGAKAINKIQSDSIRSRIKIANESKSKIGVAAEGLIVPPKPNSSTVSAPNGVSKSTPAQTREFDWTERYQKNSDDARNKLKDAASNTYIDYLGISEDDFKRGKKILDNEAPTIEQLKELKSMAEKSGLSINDLTRTLTSGTWTASRQSALQQLVEHDKAALEEQKKVIDQYKTQYDTALSKIDSNYISKIETGELSTDNLSGAEAENVQAAIAAYDKLKASKDKQINLQKNYTESFMESYENQAAAVKAENEELKASSSLIEKQIAYMKTAGELIDASVYNKLIEQSKKQEANTQRLIEIKRKEMQDLQDQQLNSENSETYRKLDQEVSDLESSILDLKKSQEEYNFQLLKMPIEHMETVAGMYKNIQTTMENWNSELEASGKKADSSYYQKLISNGFTLMDQYQKQVGLIEDVMNEYDAGSDNWNELYGKLQNVNSEMSSMVQNLHKWNEALLKMPLEKITANSSDLQKLLSGLESVKGEYDTVISAVTGAINDQVKAINEQKEAVNEEYEASKKSLQDKLDLLNKQNEKLKLQQRYEQSLYDLQKANRQATEKVIRDGQVVYEQDADKLRQAKEAVQDAKFSLEADELKTQIDSLQETLNGLNDKYQDQLDSLQKISDKWSEINGKISQAQNESKANEVLGNGWKEKVLSGNDTKLFQNFTQMYTGISEQILQYKEQLDTTNQISALLESYISSYKDGTLSYTQALTGINDLLSQLNQKMSATEGLQNLYDYYGAIKGTAANGDSILSGIQKSLAATAGDLMKSLEQYNKNYGAISEYTSSWQQLTDNVASMLRVLKEVRDNLESTEDDDDDDKKNKNYSKGEPYMGGGWVSGGPGDHSGKNVEYQKTGIQGGLIGNNTPFNREANMKFLGLKKLELDEFPAILHKNEAVFNTDQQDTLLSNLGQAWNYTPFASSFLADTSKGTGQTTTNFEFGDIRIESCNNANELAQGILNGGLRNAMIQHTGKR